MSFNFKCPRCSGSTFGSVLSPGYAVLKRHCHGYMPDGLPCRFTWDETDDAKYGLTPIGVQPTVTGMSVTPYEEPKGS